MMFEIWILVNIPSVSRTEQINTITLKFRCCAGRIDNLMNAAAALLLRPETMNSESGVKKK
jgi:hypothetical protein